MTAIQDRSPLGYVVQYILESGLLLDEDIDFVLLNVNSTDDDPKSTLSVIQKLFSGLSLASTVFFIQQKTPIGYVSVAVTPFVIVAFQHASKVIYRKRQRNNVEALLKLIGDVCKMNNDIIKYFKEKPGSNNSSAINMFTNVMKTFIDVFFKEAVLLLKVFIQFIKTCAIALPTLLTEYFELVSHMDLEIFTAPDIMNIKSCIRYVTQMRDIYLYTTSSLLTCLAITVSSGIVSDVNFLETIVPLKNQTLASYKTINKKFYDVKYYYLNAKNFKVPKRGKNFGSEPKLYMSTYNMLAQCSNIMEKSQLVLEKLHKHPLRTLRDKKLLGDCIFELCGQVCGYYEALYVLQKLYEIDINKASFAAPRNARIEIPIQSSRQLQNVPDASLNSTEPANDEEYELFIAATDQTRNERPDYNFYEEDRTYAAVLNRELKQKLKEHSRFRAAQQKRGIVNIDEEAEALQVRPPAVKPSQRVQRRRQYIYRPVPENNQPQLNGRRDDFGTEGLPPPPPRSVAPVDMAPLQHPPLKNQNATEPLSPPPPPPMPLFEMGPSGDNFKRTEAAEHFLDSIQAFSTSRQVNEDVFQ